MCLARKAPNPVLIVLWANLPSSEGDFDSEDGNIVMLFKAKQLLQQDGSERGVPQALPALPCPKHTQKQTVLCGTVLYRLQEMGLMLPHDLLALGIGFVLFFFLMFEQGKIIETTI